MRSEDRNRLRSAVVFFVRACDLSDVAVGVSVSLVAGGQVVDAQWGAGIAAIRVNAAASSSAQGQVDGMRRCRRRPLVVRDRKSTRLNSSHLGISYAVFCLKKK